MSHIFILTKFSISFASLHKINFREKMPYFEKKSLQNTKKMSAKFRSLETLEFELWILIELNIHISNSQ